MASADSIQAQERIQKAMGQLINDIDKSHLRKIQMKMHLCAAKCCQDEKTTLEQAHACVEQCSVQVNAAQNFVQDEVGHLQKRLERCIMDCQDNAREKLIGLDHGSSEEEKVKHQFEKCAINCVDDNCKTIPTLFKRLQKALDSHMK